MEKFRTQTIFVGHSEYRLREFEEIASTNTACLEEARSGDNGNLWISAASQKSGKGRSGRTWISDAGNLYASLLLIDPVQQMSFVSQLPILSAVALGEALSTLTEGGLKVEYKWPNDLLVAGEKISGILLESERRMDQRLAVVIGFGVNCRSHPDNLPYRATDIASHGYSAKPDELLHGLMESVNKWLGIWDCGRNFDAVRDEWLKKAVGLGAKIAVQSPNRMIEGKFLGIDGRGCLEMELPNGENRSISAGELLLSDAYAGMETAC